MPARVCIIVGLVVAFFAWARVGAAQSDQSADPVIQAAARAKAEADAQKAAYEAQKAAYEARAAALKAAIGEVPPSGISGGVEVASDGGKGEATLLSARAVADVAHALASKVAGRLSPDRTVRIFLGADKPQLDSWQIFDVRKKLLTRSAQEADVLARQADDALTELRAEKFAPMGFAPVAGLALSALSKLGAFFQSEYRIGGYALTADDIELANAVAGNLSAMCPNAKVLLAGTMPTVTGSEDLYAELVDLAQASTSAQARAAAFEQNIKDVRAMAAAEKDAKRLAELAAAADAATEAMTALRAVSAGYDGLIASLTTADDKGVYQIAKVAEQRKIQQSLASGELVLFLKTHSAVGGYYTKKSLWTFLGSMPFYAMGGAVVSYSLIDGKTGEVQLAGVTTRHGGYQKLAKAERSVNKDEPPVAPVAACN